MIVRIYFCVALALVVVLLFVFSNKKGILSRRLARQAARSPHKALHGVGG